MTCACAPDQVTTPSGTQLRLHLVVTGIKGDWPWLRRAMWLKTGYTSLRKCHICDSTAAWFLYQMVSIRGSLQNLAPTFIRGATTACTQDWFDLSRRGGVRTLRRGDPAPSPYKETVSALRGLSSIGDNPMAVRPDPAHTYAINGWGKDLCGGALLLLIHLGLLAAGSLESSLDLGFQAFRNFCRATGRTTSLTEFSLKAMKITSSPSLVANFPYIFLRGFHHVLRLCGSEAEILPTWTGQRA